MRGKLVKLVLFSFYNLRIVNCTLKMQFGLWDAARKCFYCGNTQKQRADGGGFRIISIVLSLKKSVQLKGRKKHKEMMQNN